MTSPTHITALEVKDFKRIRAVAMEPSPTGLTVIGGNNCQGKTSILDAIAYTLGGENFRPSSPVREGATEAFTQLTLSNGLTVRRDGVNGALKVTDPTGKKQGAQTLLNSFVNTFALDLPSFLHSTAKEKADKLLAIFPHLGQQLKDLNNTVKARFEERTVIGRQVDQKRKYAAELPIHFDVPVEPLSGLDMTKKMQAALLRNAENQKLRERVPHLRNNVANCETTVARLRRELAEAEAKFTTAKDELARAESASASLADEDTSTIQRQLEELDATNAKIRANLEKQRAEHDANELAKQYEELTTTIEDARAKRLSLLSSVPFPYPGLSFDEAGELTLDGKKWDCLSGSQQIVVAAAIASAIKPECGFILLDGLEAFDPTQLSALSDWLKQRNMQAIGTRVSTGDECSIVIEDGLASDAAGLRFT